MKLTQNEIINIQFLNFKLCVDYPILGKFHWNICIFKDFKGVGQFCPPPLVQIGSFSTLVQIGLIGYNLDGIKIKKQKCYLSGPFNYVSFL